MKRTIFALLIVTALVAATAFGVAYWLRCRSCAAPRVNLVRELNLTGAQAAQVTALEAEYERRLAEICAAHCAARAALAAALADRAQAAECCARMCAAQSASEKLALDHVFQVRAVLTPAQQQRHLALVQQQLSGACPMRLHRP
jgi:nickel and cobalt resistance protein CnrR